jgi:hypothetical protein
VGQGSERASAAHHDLGPVSLLPERTSDGVVDLRLHLLPMLVAQRVGPDKALGDTYRAERERVDLVDGSTSRKDNLDAPSADVHDGGGAPLEIEMPRSAPEGELCLLGAGDHIDPNLVLPQHFPDERRSVGRFPDRARGDRPELGYLKAIRNGLHLAQGGEAPLDGLVGQAAGAIQVLAQSDHFTLFVQDPVGVVLLNLGDDQPNGVGPDINGG